jgi:hypothetical protein
MNDFYNCFEYKCGLLLTDAIHSFKGYSDIGFHEYSYSVNENYHTDEKFRKGFGDLMSLIDCEKVSISYGDSWYSRVSPLIIKQMSYRGHNIKYTFNFN